MVKRRERAPKPSSAEIDAWAARADGHDYDPIDFLDKAAPRTFKAIRVPFNEYEYRMLERLAKEHDRSMSFMIRQAIIEAATKGRDSK
jgi:hypothetical protein